jgi:hypothetical protein
LRAACQQPILTDQFPVDPQQSRMAPKTCGVSMRIAAESSDQTVPTRADLMQGNVMEADDGAVQWYPERCEYLSDIINGKWLRTLRERFKVGA